MVTIEQRSEIHRLNLHNTYDVNWGIEKIARDIVQNFFDSVGPETFDDQVQVDLNTQTGVVTISGPGEFDLDLLFRIGVTTKTGQADRFAGQFGEGFVIATLVIMRDFQVGVSARVGNRLAEFFFQSVNVSDQVVEELCCRVTSVLNGRVAGNEVIISHCNEDVLSAFGHAKALFRYERNPTFGVKLAEDVEQGLYVYRSKSPGGKIFYRHQSRASYNLPFILCCDRSTKGVRSERDRSDLLPREIKRVVQEVARCMNGDVIESVVLGELRHLWERGHPMLTVLAERWSELYGWNPPSRVIAFPEGYLAKGGGFEDREAREGGSVLCFGAMWRFGMPRPAVLKRELAQRSLRSPDATEDRLFNLLKDCCSQVCGSIQPGLSYFVFVPEKGSDHYEGWYLDRKIVLNEDVLLGDFPHALSVFLHEESHVIGGDWTRAFSDRLTYLIEKIAANRKALDQFEGEWTAIQRSAVFLEKAGRCTSSGFRS